MKRETKHKLLDWLIARLVIRGQIPTRLMPIYYKLRKLEKKYR